MPDYILYSGSLCLTNVSKKLPQSCYFIIVSHFLSQIIGVVVSCFVAIAGSRGEGGKYQVV